MNTLDFDIVQAAEQHVERHLKFLGHCPVIRNTLQPGSGIQTKTIVVAACPAITPNAPAPPSSQQETALRHLATQTGKTPWLAKIVLSTANTIVGEIEYIQLT